MCGDPLRERHEIGDGELFGALCEERVLRSSEIAERRTQRIAQHLAALAERGFHNPHEQFLIAVKPCYGIAAQPDDSAFDLRRRVR